MSIQAREASSVTEFNQEKLDLIKSVFAKDATDMEFDLFIAMSKRLQLDPVIKQIYFVKFGGKMSIIVSIDGYRLIADRTGRYMPGKETTFTYDKNGVLFSATSYVKKLSADGQWHEFGATAIRSEYDTNMNQWKKGPHYMLAKCAESLALRKGWPAEYSGTHTEEEMDKVIVDNEVSKKSQPQLQGKGMHQADAQVIEKAAAPPINEKELIAECVEFFQDKECPDFPVEEYLKFCADRFKKSKGEIAKGALENNTGFAQAYKKWADMKTDELLAQIKSPETTTKA